MGSNWDKMVAFLMGLKDGFTKYPCYLCLWDSRATASHYHKKHWPERTEYIVDNHNHTCESLVEHQKVLFPS